MTYLIKLGLPVMGGMLAVSAIDIFGSIAWQRYGFSYGIVLSFLVYVSTGFFLGRNLDVVSTLCGTELVCMFEATVGLYLTKRFNGRLESDERTVWQMSQEMVRPMFIIGIVLGSLGYCIALPFKS